MDAVWCLSVYLSVCRPLLSCCLVASSALTSSALCSRNDGGLCYLQAAARARDAHGVRGRPGQVGLHVPVGLRAADLPSRAGVSRARRVVGRRAVRFARLRAARRGLGGLAAGVPPLRQGGSLLDALGAQHARLPSVHVAPVRRAGSADAGVGARWHKLPAERHRGIPVRRREPAWPACRACGSQRRDCGTPLSVSRVRMSLQRPNPSPSPSPNPRPNPSPSPSV